MRAAIFIDGAYLQTQLKNYGGEPDYLHIADHLLAPLRSSIDLDLLRCYYYYCPPYMSQEPTEDELKRMEVHEKFVADIQSLGRWAVRLGKLQKRWEGQREIYEQKRVDVLLSVDMVRHAAAGHVQHAILVAGDSDFIPAVQAAKEHGVTVSLWCGAAKTVHKELIDLCDEVYAFDWNTFPLLNRPAAARSKSRGSSPNPSRVAAESVGSDQEGDTAAKSGNAKRRRRGGRGRRRGGGAGEGEPATESKDEAPKKSAWRERIKSLTAKKRE